MKSIFESDPAEGLPLQIKIRPRISGSTRITRNETQVGLIHLWVIYVERQKAKKNIFEPDPAEDRTTTFRMWNKQYHVAIRDGLYRKAVQVCYVPIQIKYISNSTVQRFRTILLIRTLLNSAKKTQRFRETHT